MSSNFDFIPHSRPMLGPAEIQAVSDVLVSGQIAQGPVVAQFEREFADTFGYDHAIATSSGTAALHLALMGLDIRVGDEVIVPAYVCTALLNAVHYVGAIPVLADVDDASGNLDAATVRACITAATRAIIVPHMFGLPVDLEPLAEFEIPIIEDCAQAVGAVINNRPVGAAGEVAIFSFYATKLLTTGEGGMVACRSAALAERLMDLRSYDERADYLTRYNYKLTDIQAALGRCQLDRLKSMLARRRAIAAFYSAVLQGLGLGLPPEPQGRVHFRYTLGVKSNLGGWLRKMAEQGIGCARPVHRPLNACLGLGTTGFPGTERAFQHLLSIPIYPALEAADLERVVSAIKKTRVAMQ